MNSIQKCQVNSSPSFYVPAEKQIIYTNHNHSLTSFTVTAYEYYNKCFSKLSSGVLGQAVEQVAIANRTGQPHLQ